MVGGPERLKVVPVDLGGLDSNNPFCSGAVVPQVGAGVGAGGKPGKVPGQCKICEGWRGEVGERSEVRESTEVRAPPPTHRKLKERVHARSRATDL